MLRQQQFHMAPAIQQQNSTASTSLQWRGGRGSCCLKRFRLSASCQRVQCLYNFTPPPEIVGSTRYTHTHTHTHKPYPLQNNLTATSRRKKLMMQCETISRALLAVTQLDMDKSTTTRARSTMMSSTVNKRNRMCSTTR